MFLAGPSPRDKETKTWRPDFIRELFDSGFKGTIINPENKEFNEEFNYDKQVEWENNGLNTADLIVFWVPRDLDTLPGFTTNIEFGLWAKSGKCVLGYPADAEKMRYLHWLAEKNKIPIYNDIKSLIEYINLYFNRD